MIKLIETFPSLAREVSESLRALGRSELAEQLDAAVVARVTFDESAGAGYVYVESGRHLNVVEANVIGARHGETITVETQFDAVIDVDNFGRLMGIEILAPGVLATELKRRASA
jgi:uncharacterized protein YuzE